jgi:hypothetical protein
MGHCQWEYPDPFPVEHLFTLRARVSRAATIKGEVGGPSGDWVRLGADRSMRLDVRMLLRTDDGADIGCARRRRSRSPTSTTRVAEIERTRRRRAGSHSPAGDPAPAVLVAGVRPGGGGRPGQRDAGVHRCGHRRGERHGEPVPHGQHGQGTDASRRHGSEAKLRSTTPSAHPVSSAIRGSSKPRRPTSATSVSPTIRLTNRARPTWPPLRFLNRCRRVSASQRASDDEVLDLVGSFPDLEHLRIAVEASHRGLEHVADSAMDLYSL